MKNILSLGQFRNEISALSGLHLTRDEPLEPLSVSIPVDRVCVVLGASPYIVLHYGSAAAVLSHITEIIRSNKGGRKSYKTVCNSYASSDVPVQMQFRLFYTVTAPEG